jgi:hypothetical protein
MGKCFAIEIIDDIQDSNLPSIHQCIVHEIDAPGTVNTIWLS